jgi:hypothetical protein
VTTDSDRGTVPAFDGPVDRCLLAPDDPDRHSRHGRRRRSAGYPGQPRVDRVLRGRDGVRLLPAQAGQSERLSARDALSALALLGPQAPRVAFIFFGLHCLTVGYLIIRSTFLPRAVGAPMVLGGLGWLTFSLTTLLSPPLARLLTPYIMFPGILGEATLTFWLLVKGVNVQRWNERARATERPRPELGVHA